MKKFIILISLILLLAAGCNSQPVNTQVPNTQNQNNSYNPYETSTTEYKVGGVTVDYAIVERKPSTKVNVFIKKEGETITVIREAYLDERTVAKFFPTDDPNVVVLAQTESFGGEIQIGIIDIKKQQGYWFYYAKDYPNFNIYNSAGKSYAVQTVIDDKCMKGGTPSATVKNLTLDDNVVYNFSPAFSIGCSGNGGFDPLYKYNPVIKPVGISKDFSRVFFVLQGIEYNPGDGKQTVKLQKFFSFNVTDKVVKSEQATDFTAIKENY